MTENPFYPGSRQRKDQPRSAVREQLSFFDFEKPRVYIVRGKQTEFFTIGQLAKALGRQSVTVRKWEQTGIIPRATFQAPNPKKDDRARRRLYSRAQAEGIVRIALEEGIIGTGRVPISRTQFTERVTELFRELLNESK